MFECVDAALIIELLYIAPRDTHVTHNNFEFPFSVLQFYISYLFQKDNFENLGSI